MMGRNGIGSAEVFSAAEIVVDPLVAGSGGTRPTREIDKEDLDLSGSNGEESR
jgi:hypothetical protein